MTLESRALRRRCRRDSANFLINAVSTITTDEVKDPQKLNLWLELNGKKVQDGTTATMVFGVAHVVAYLSQFFTLMPGDVITTGTPPGVGMGMKPQRFLKPGDVMRICVEGLGVQQQTVVRDK